MPFLDRAGIRLYFEVHGSGPTLLLTHGYNATSRMWRPQVEALASDHSLVLWDMRGHGQSDSPTDPDDYGERHTISDMLALLDHVGASEAIIGGLSLGGYMSLAFALAHPERVTALVVTDSGPGFKRDDKREKWNAMARGLADGIVNRGYAALPVGNTEMNATEHRDPRGLEMAARYALTQSTPAVIEGLDQIAKPTLVMVGDRDRQYLAATEYMANKIPGARQVVIEDAGHAANLDQPEAFNDAVLRFLGGIGIQGEP